MERVGEKGSREGEGFRGDDAKTRDDGGASKSEPLGELGIPEPRGAASEEIFPYTHSWLMLCFWKHANVRQSS